MTRAVTVLLVVLAFCACGDDPLPFHADLLGVGAECARDTDCVTDSRDGGFDGRCLTQFKGGYCGVQGCESHGDCPLGAACVAHEDGRNYCFRICRDKSECNVNRSPDSESNCSSSVTYVEGDTGAKACVPPSDSIKASLATSARRRW